MKIYLTVLMLLFTIKAQAVDLYVGAGLAYKSDEGDSKVYSLSLVDENITYNISNFKDYDKSPWPNWKLTDSRLPVPEHYVFSVEYRVLESSAWHECTVYFDMGIAYSNRISRANSSHLVFKESIGIQYKKIFRIYVSHTSNAGLVPPNIGDDQVSAIFKLYEF